MFGSLGPRSDNAGSQTVSYNTVRSFPGSYAASLAAARWDCSALLLEVWAFAFIAIQLAKNSTVQKTRAR